MIVSPGAFKNYDRYVLKYRVLNLMKMHEIITHSSELANYGPLNVIQIVV